MAKKILEDIKIKKNKILTKDLYFDDLNIDNKKYIKVSDDSEKINSFSVQRETKRRLHSTPRIKINHRSINKTLIWVLIITIFISCAYFISNKFINANIQIINKHQVFTLSDKEFMASKELDSKIPFEIMIVSSEESKNMILLQTKDVSIKARGEITLYNEYSTKPQNIAIHTYLSDNDGKTYVTDKAVSIPGYKINKDKTIIPGFVTVGITAFLPGSAYNGTPSDFKVSSFKGTTKYKKIYGKTTNPIIGGAQGVVYTVGDEDKINIDAFANSSFKNNLIKKANALVPPGYILYPNAFKFSYQTNSDILSEEPKVDIKIYGTLSAVILKENNLSSSVVKSLIPNVSDKELREIQTPNISNLSFSFVDDNQVISKEMQNVSFSLNGDLELIWNPDVELLKKNLIGISKNNVLPIFKQDPAITTATIRIFPPWQSYIPNDLEKINIIVN